MPSVPPWEAGTQRWQLYRKFTLPANIWFHREGPRDPGKLQSRQKLPVFVCSSSELENSDWTYTFMSLCLFWKKTKNSKKTIVLLVQKIQLSDADMRLISSSPQALYYHLIAYYIGLLNPVLRLHPRLAAVVQLKGPPLCRASSPRSATSPAVNQPVGQTTANETRL